MRKMKEKDPYRRVIGLMKQHAPELQGMDQLEEEVVERIRRMERQSGQERAGRSLFSWTEVEWLRRTLVTAAVVVIGLFLFQQVSLNRRIDRLEERVVTVSGPGNIPESGPGAAEKVLINLVTRDPAMVDSVLVSRSDLEELLKSYLELEEETRRLKESLEADPLRKLNL